MTDRGIPEEMKTGFNLVKDDDKNVVENIASIVLVFMENAVKSADIYVRHSKRTTITSQDIKRGLMLEVFFMKQRPNMLEQCEEMKKIIKRIQEEDDSDSDSDTSLDQLSNIYADEEEVFKESECSCPMCGCMNTIYTRWDSFTPETAIEKAMAKHINDIS
tara:strand:- start:322 stop:804 length:483 start_codon:yes stop_codon:yes gene_type:complete